MSRVKQQVRRRQVCDFAVALMARGLSISNMHGLPRQSCGVQVNHLRWDPSLAGFGQSASAAVRYSARLVRAGASTSGVLSPDRPSALSGAWLITGGVGALGTLMASWIESQEHTSRLTLCSRSGRSALGSAVLARLTQSGCFLTIVRCSQPFDSAHSVQGNKPDLTSVVVLWCFRKFAFGHIQRISL